jgi:hypothetical protein
MRRVRENPDLLSFNIEKNEKWENARNVMRNEIFENINESLCGLVTIRTK